MQASPPVISFLSNQEVLNLMRGKHTFLSLSLLKLANRYANIIYAFIDRLEQTLKGTEK